MVAFKTRQMHRLNQSVRTTVAIIFGCCLLIAAPLYAVPSPAIPEFTAYYDLKRNGKMKIGEVKRSVTIAENQTITFDSYSRTTGLAALFIKDKISERSTFTLAGHTIQPHHYLYDRTGGKRSRTTKLSFDWGDKSVTNAIDGAPWEVALSPNTQDKLSYQLQLMLDLQSGATTFNYPVADDGIMKPYRFTILGEETLKTQMGTLQTIKIKRERAADSKRKTTIWFAKSLHYLPVRIQQGKSDDEFIMLEINKVEGM